MLFDFMPKLACDETGRSGRPTLTFGLPNRFGTSLNRDLNNGLTLFYTTFVAFKYGLNIKDDYNFMDRHFLFR